MASDNEVKHPIHKKETVRHKHEISVDGKRFQEILKTTTTLDANDDQFVKNVLKRKIGEEQLKTTEITKNGKTISKTGDNSGENKTFEEEWAANWNPDYKMQSKTTNRSCGKGVPVKVFPVLKMRSRLTLSDSVDSHDEEAEKQLDPETKSTDHAGHKSKEKVTDGGRQPDSSTRMRVAKKYFNISAEKKSPKPSDANSQTQSLNNPNQGPNKKPKPQLLIVVQRPTKVCSDSSSKSSSSKSSAQPNPMFYTVKSSSRPTKAMVTKPEDAGERVDMGKKDLTSTSEVTSLKGTEDNSASTSEVSSSESTEDNPLKVHRLKSKSKWSAGRMGCCGKKEKKGLTTYTMFSISGNLPKHGDPVSMQFMVQKHPK